MATPLPPSSPGDQNRLVQGTGANPGTEQKLSADAGAARLTAESVGQAATNDWKPLDLNQLDSVSDSIEVHSKGGTNIFLPSTVDLRKFTLGQNGPSIQIAQNIGATPVQITTADGKDLLTSNIASDNYKRELGGAGSIGGIPIVGPAGRLASGEKYEPTIYLDGQKQIDLKPSWIGENGRIATDGNGVISHGPLFTSDKWKLTAIQTKGDNGNKGIELTYTLPLNDARENSMSDIVVDAFVQKLNDSTADPEPGKIEAKYTFTIDDNDNPKFNSDIRIDPGEGNRFLLGSLAQHTFLKSEVGDTLQTNATQEYDAPSDRPELPNGNLIDVRPENDFSKARVVHKDEGKVQTVLTGYKETPEAVLKRQDGLTVISKAGHDYDGFLLCNYGDGNVMLEPISKAPNIINTNPQNALIPTHENQARFGYELSLAA